MIGMKKNTGAGLVLALTLVLRVQAHIALWDPAMYGWNDDPNQYEPVLPLERLPFNQWWFHNYVDKPPAPGKIMNLPAGGTYHGQVACNKAWTTYGSDPTKTSAEYACDDNKPNSGTGAMHTTDHMGSTPQDVKGCGLSIAYESDVNKLKPEDFTVISIAYDCPWKRNVDFPIPADLPACPEGGCHCSWGWVHSKDGGSPQMYQLGYRCDVTGATMDRPLPKPLVSKKCDYPNDVSNCTVGAKQPHYWLQAEGNNNFQGEHDPPYYNHEMGFMNGAQTDLFAGAPALESTPGPAAFAPAPGSASVSAEASVSIAVAAPVSSSSAQEPVSFELPSSTSSIQTLSPTASPLAPAGSIAQSISGLANNSASSSATVSVSASACSSTPSASAIAASKGRCRRRKRSMDVQRHHARAASLRNRTIGVRHTTASIA